MEGESRQECRRFDSVTGSVNPQLPRGPRRFGSSRGAQPRQLRLVNDLNAELLRLIQLGAVFRAGDDVVSRFAR